jgi:ATP-dependent Clp protease ATP-binding subunit ClpA
MDRLRASLVRLLPVADRMTRPKLPLDVGSRATVERAFALARERRYENVTLMHLFQALVEDPSGPVAALLISVGANHDVLLEKLRRA